MRLPDFSGTMRQPAPDMNADELGKLLLSYVSSRRAVAGLDFRTAALRTAELRGAALAGVGLTDANLFSADLRGASLEGAVLERANLQRAQLAEADLRNARLTSAQLESAQLMGAVLQFADLQRTRLQYANLHRADLSQADLRGAILQRARLRQASLRSADLRGVDLHWADLLGADVTGAHIDREGIRRSGWSPGDLQDFQRRGLVVSDTAPARPQPAAPAAPADAASGEGLLLRFPTPLSHTEAALFGVVVAAWQDAAAERDAAVDTRQRPLLVTATDPDELEALAELMRDGRWAALRLGTLLSGAALEGLAERIAGRDGFELWIQKSDGLRAVLRW